MPTHQDLKLDECLICSGLKSQSQGKRLCSKHFTKVIGIIEDMLSIYNGDFVSLFNSILDIGTERHIVDLHSLQTYLNVKFEYKPSPVSRFNTTQALKKYCRDIYRGSSNLTKPPKNKASKASFVKWAKINGVDISNFRTRSYKRRNMDSGSIQPLISNDSSRIGNFFEEKEGENTNKSIELKYHQDGFMSQASYPMSHKVQKKILHELPHQIYSQGPYIPEFVYPSPIEFPPSNGIPILSHIPNGWYIPWFVDR